ncbi:MAG: 2Fe-2S iron-sulfur cluster-binding protein [Kiloniellales bacterium]
MSEQGSDERPFYRFHVFCCVNRREAGHPRSCCADRGSVALRDYMKDRVKKLGIENIRINQAGCMERCELGPAMVVYPEGVWYGYRNEADIDQILEEHLLGGRPVERLLLANDQKLPKFAGREALTLRVAAVTTLTGGSHEIKSFELRAPDGGLLPVFEAGAHIDVVTASGERRSYSLANAPGERDRYLVGVLREKDGRGGSAWIHEAVKAGDTITVLPPLNNFPLHQEASEHILIGGGIGITPLLAMGHRLKALGANTTLHYCTRSPGATAFLAEASALFGERLMLYHDGGEPGCGIDLGATLAARPEGAHLYICGPLGLLAAARAASAHWPQGTVHFELFAPPAPAPHQPDQAFEIFLSRRKQTLTVPADRSILEVLRAAGVAIDYSCEAGICGTCRTRLISGEPDHRDEVLTPAEKAAKADIMVCISRAKPGQKLVLDI